LHIETGIEEEGKENRQILHRVTWTGTGSEIHPSFGGREGGVKLEEVITVKTTRRHGQEKHNLNIHHRENLKSYVPLTECRLPCI
jgi:hypothetical protein